MGTGTAGRHGVCPDRVPIEQLRGGSGFTARRRLDHERHEMARKPRKHDGALPFPLFGPFCGFRGPNDPPGTAAHLRGGIDAWRLRQRIDQPVS